MVWPVRLAKVIVAAAWIIQTGLLICLGAACADTRFNDNVELWIFD